MVDTVYYVHALNVRFERPACLLLVRYIPEFQCEKFARIRQISSELRSRIVDLT